VFRLPLLPPKHGDAAVVIMLAAVARSRGNRRVAPLDLDGKRRFRLDPQEDTHCHA
jgi:hypothetical protein